MADGLLGLFQSTMDSAGGAVNDLFTADADRSKAQGFRYKAQGEQFEKTNYLEASDLATQNEKFTEQSTAIKQAQTQRQIDTSLGNTQAQVAGAGFANSGSSIDLLRDSASQGALTKAVGAEQGLITEAGYKQQAQSYQNLASAADVAIAADNDAAKAEEHAAVGADIGAGIKGVEALVTGGLMIAALL